MKTIYIIILMTFAGVQASLGQTRCNIKKAYAYYTVSFPGAQMVDENGNPIPPKPIIDRFIYIEAIGNTKPDIDAITYGSNTLTATVVAVNRRTVIPGGELHKANNTKIVASRSNTLWKIELQPKDGDSMPDQDCSKIIIKTTVKGKACTIKLAKEIKLASMPRY